MRRAHLFLGLCGIAIAASTLLVIRAVRPTPEDRSTSTVSPGTGGQEGSSASAEPAIPRPGSTDGARKVVTPELEAEDPCASLMAELEAERAAHAAAEQEVTRLRGELAEATRKLDAMRFPEDTPYGAFLASPEADQIADAAIRRGIKACLDEFPVFLRPGEATWIAEREVANDWRQYGRSTQEALVYFLGPERLAAEVPLDTLFEDYLWDLDYGPRLQATLPPEKRAELNAKLHALMEKSDDPEEIAWLRNRFPSFFD
jgi:hypothetical protein